MSALRYGPSTLRWRSPVVKRLSDERLVASVRRGNHADFTVLVKRYETRLLAFCRQMLRSREDAEDVLQEVFVAAFNAILADDRPINVQPWLYRIARNRSLNHMRRIKAISVDPMEMPESEVSAGTVETVHAREELRMLVGDIQKLPESQRSALLLREMEALSYDQIAEAMDKSVPSVKSLLVRARVSLATAREERGLHRKVAALAPLGSLVSVKRLLIGHLGHSTGAGGATAATGSGAATAAAGSGAATAAAGTGAAIAGSSSWSAVALGVGAVATKTAAGLAAAALVTAGAVAIEDGGQHSRHRHRAPVAAAQGSASTRLRGAQMIAAAPGGSAPGHSSPASSPSSGLQNGPMKPASGSSSSPPPGHGPSPAGGSPAPGPAPVAPTSKRSQSSGQAPGQPPATATTARVVTDVTSSTGGSTDTTTTTATTTTSTTMMTTASTATATTATATTAIATTATTSTATAQSTSTFTPASHATTSALATEGRDAHRHGRHRRPFAFAGPWR